MRLADRRRVLLIDDDPHLLQAMAAAFGFAGYDVQEAADGDEALWLFNRLSVDAVVTDVTLPARDGIGVIATIKRLRPAVKVVALSGAGWSGPDDHLSVARHVGADGIMCKPFPEIELVALVHGLLAAA